LIPLYGGGGGGGTGGGRHATKVQGLGSSGVPQTLPGLVTPASSIHIRAESLKIVDTQYFVVVAQQK